MIFNRTLVVQDVTERKLIELKLQRQRNFYEVLSKIN
ncbi:MAG: hypothetical protein RLZ92_645, partial [Pseudomonadota bacterium]